MLASTERISGISHCCVTNPVISQANLHVSGLLEQHTLATAKKATRA